MCKALTLVAISLLATSGFAQSDGTEAAKAHYAAGTHAYDLGHYLDAAKEYEAAYEAKEFPQFLFNIGQAYRLGGEPEKAIHFYEAYLRHVPGALNRSDVEARITELQKIVEEQARAKAGPPKGTIDPSATPPVATSRVTVAEAPRPRRPVYRQWWLWTTIGVVVVAVGVGLGVGLSQTSTTYPVANLPGGTFRW